MFFPPFPSHRKPPNILKRGVTRLVLCPVRPRWLGLQGGNGRGAVLVRSLELTEAVPGVTCPQHHMSPVSPVPDLTCPQCHLSPMSPVPSVICLQ